MKHKAKTFDQFVNESELPEAPVKISHATPRENLTDAQYAVMYLLFKGKTNLLQQPYRSQDDKNLRIFAGLSDQTVRHRIREMKILAGGEDQALKGDEYFEDVLSKMADGEVGDINDLRKTARLYYQFQEMPINDVLNLAMEAFTDDNKERGQHFYDKNIEKQSKYAAEKKNKDSSEKKQIIQFVSDYTKTFGAKMPFPDAKTKAIKLAAQKFNKKDSEISLIVHGKQ